LVQTSVHKNGEKDGLTKSYYESGQLESEVFYKDGIPVEGTRKEYDEKGNLKEVRKHSYYESGQLSSEAFYKDGVPVAGDNKRV